MTILDKETRPLAMLLAGFLLWAGAFILIYLAQATGCRLGWQDFEIFGVLSLQRGLLVLLYLLACGLHLRLIAGLGRTPTRAQDAFVHQTGRVLSVAALGASVFCFGGVLWLTIC